mmetsp:Transcript_3788/g.9812  ORF Transcript_3788/g.9812 Transcript_3788/m.9812 type:complete len:385 (-) Transcript_3788:165-1319(-)
MTAPAGSRPSGRCPFRLLSWPANHSSPAEGSDAPIGAPATAAKSGGGCPFRPFLAGAAPPARDTSGAEDSGAPAPERACPLGFGTPSRPQLDGEAINDALHCPLCRGMYHDAVRLKCGHWACDFCARQPSGGCGKCGEPVAITGTDNRIQGVVDLFIDGHATPEGSRERADGAEEAGQRQEGKSAPGGGAEFLLNLGLQSLAGGNNMAACSRLQRCANMLREDQTPGSSSRLAAVCGMLGDCCRSLGDFEQAKGHYREACAQYQADPKPGHQDEDSLAVLNNKLGDLEIAEDLPAAEEAYRAALRLRRAAAYGACPQRSPKAFVDLAMSLVKVADVARDTAPTPDAAAALLEEARRTLDCLRAEDMEEPLAWKCEQLRQFLIAV